jgi:hypothetical protein
MRLWAIFLLGGMLAPAADPGWQRYSNGRFGFSVCYPPELVPQGESDNGDGQTFKSRDGKVTVLAYGGFEMLPEKGRSGLQQELGFALAGARDRHFSVGYQLVKPHFFVVSGASPAGMVWYRRTQEIQDRAVTLDFEYPAAARAQMDPLVVKMTGCLAVGKMSYGK